MNIQNPPPRIGGNGAEPRPPQSLVARPKAGRSIRQRLAECAGAAQRPLADGRDLLIEHLHLIQDKYGHISGGASRRARRPRCGSRWTEVYEVATFYAHFDVVKEGETPPPPVTVRVCDLASCADGRRRASAEGSAGGCSARRSRGSRALHGRAAIMRAGLRRRPRAGERGEAGEAVKKLATPNTHAHAAQARHRFRRPIMANGGYKLLERGAGRQAHPRRADQGRQRRGPARPRWRGLPDRPQVVARARARKARG